MTNPAKLSLTNPPVAIVLAQFSLNALILTNQASCLRENFRRIGLSRMTRKHERTVSLRPGSLQPDVREKVVTVFLDPEHQRGVSLDGNNLVYFSGKHVDFSGFAAALSEIVQCFETGGVEFQAKVIALRYVNVFEIFDDNLGVMSESLRGVDWKKLGNCHHHHKYYFWCETDRGRLDLRFTTEHGNKRPENLGHADEVFSTTHLRSSDETVAHLDIFETTNPAKNTWNWDHSQNLLIEMNRTIEAAFIHALAPEALVQRFGKLEESE